MNTELVQNIADAERSGIDLVETELEFARTFCRISKQTNDPERRARTLQHAERAYKAASRAFKVFNRSDEDWSKVKISLKDIERELSYAR